MSVCKNKIAKVDTIFIPIIVSCVIYRKNSQKIHAIAYMEYLKPVCKLRPLLKGGTTIGILLLLNSNTNV